MTVFFLGGGFCPKKGNHRKWMVLLGVISSYAEHQQGFGDPRAFWRVCEPCPVLGTSNSGDGFN